MMITKSGGRVNQVRNKLKVIKIETSDRSINQFLEYLRSEKHFSQHTLRSYQSDLEQFLSHIERLKKIVTTVDHNDIRRFIAYLNSLGLKPRSVSRKLSTLKSFFKFLSVRNAISSNPLTLINYPKTDKKLPRILTETEVSELISAAKAGDHFVEDANRDVLLRDLLILEMLYGCGLRVSELCSLNVSSINAGNMEARILGKGSKERIAPLTSESVKTYEAYLTARGKLINTTKAIIPSDITLRSALFLNRFGRRLSAQGIRRVLYKYSALAALGKKINPHLLRHSFATHLLDNGADLRVVQELLGHADLSSTQVYTHISKKGLRDTYNKSHPRA